MCYTEGICLLAYILYQYKPSVDKGRGALDAEAPPSYMQVLETVANTVAVAFLCIYGKWKDRKSKRIADISKLCLGVMSEIEIL